MADTGPGGEQIGSGIWPVFAGLQLVVFVFFVYLVATARPDAVRTQLTLAGVRDRFAGSHRGAPDDGPFDAGTSALRELGGDLVGRMRLARVDRSRRGEDLVLSLPAAELFAPRERVPRDAAVPLIDRIVAALSVPPSGQRMLLTVTLGEPGETGETGETRIPTGEADDGRLSAGRAATLAASMLARGAPPDTLAFGLGAVEAGRVRLAFRLSASTAQPAAGDR